MKSLFLGLTATLALLAGVPLASSANAQGLAHSFFMRGQVVEADAQGIVLCVGKKDGAKAGQVLNVVRITPAPGPRAKNFRRETVGQVRIVEIIDDHFASATLVTGKADKHDLVELQSGGK